MSKSLIALITTALVLGLGTASTARAAAGHDDHHHHAASDGPAVNNLQLNQGKKWETDEPLRKSMAAIRDELAAAWKPMHDGTYTAAQYAALAGRIEAQIAHIVANCRLPPDADAQLHLVVADIVSGATAMKADKDQMNGTIQVFRALNAYPKFFVHPGWKPLSH